MIVVGFLIGVFSLTLWATDSPGPEEIAAWESALSTGDAVDLEQFLENFPSSVFSSEAEALLLSVSASKPTATGSSLNISTSSVPLYEQPVQNDVFAEQPRSIRELAAGTPLFPPVEGLPVEYWEGEVCSNCHNWEKANLCEQGQYFAQRDQTAIDRIQHPYGGFFKSAIKQWAAKGCE